MFRIDQNCKERADFGESVGEFGAEFVISLCIGPDSFHDFPAFHGELGEKNETTKTTLFGSAARNFQKDPEVPGSFQPVAGVLPEVFDDCSCQFADLHRFQIKYILL